MAESTTELRRYHVLDVIGRGGFGTVYRAELLGAGGFTKIVAVKVLHATVGEDPALLGRLRDEARILGLLRHRAIVQVDGLVRLAGRWALVMEYVPGVTVADARKATGPLPPAVALEIVGEVAGAVAAAWETPGPSGEPLHLLHRDIKPGNIQLTRAGEVKLLDFGVARAQIPDRTGSSQGLVYGSVHYLAPERLQLRDGPEGDVYGLGATLLEALSGRMPGGIADNSETHAARVDAGVDPLSSSGGAPAQLVELIRLCLAFDPAIRPTARDLERRCRQLAREIGGIELREWAEAEIPRVDVAPTSLQPDDLAGQVITESGGVGEPSPFAGIRRAETTFDDPVDPAPVVPQPPESLSRPPLPRASLLRRAAIWTFWLSAGGLVLSVLVAFALTLTGAAGFAGLIAWMWPQMSRSSCVDVLVRVERLVSSTRASPARDRVIARLNQRAVTDCNAGKIGIWEGATFETRAENAAEDGLITDIEAADLLALYDDVSR